MLHWRSLLLISSLALFCFSCSSSRPKESGTENTASTKPLGQIPPPDNGDEIDLENQGCLYFKEYFVLAVNHHLQYRTLEDADTLYRRMFKILSIRTGTPLQDSDVEQSDVCSGLENFFERVEKSKKEEKMSFGYFVLKQALPALYRALDPFSNFRFNIYDSTSLPTPADDYFGLGLHIQTPLSFLVNLKATLNTWFINRLDLLGPASEKKIPLGAEIEEVRVLGKASPDDEDNCGQGKGWQAPQEISHSCYRRMQTSEFPGIDLRWKQPEGDQAKETSLVATELPLAPMDVHFDRNNTIMYLYLSDFSLRTPLALTKVNEALVAADRNPLLIILDLRNNPGGLLCAIVDLAQAFLIENQPIYRTYYPRKDRYYDFHNDGEAQCAGLVTDPKERQQYIDQVQSLASARFHGRPIIVLQNRLSTSATENLTHALRDNGMALVAGSPSLGKELALGSGSKTYRIAKHPGWWAQISWAISDNFVFGPLGSSIGDPVTLDIPAELPADRDFFERYVAADRVDEEFLFNKEARSRRFLRQHYQKFAWSDGKSPPYWPVIDRQLREQEKAKGAVTAAPALSPDLHEIKELAAAYPFEKFLSESGCLADRQDCPVEYLMSLGSLFLQSRAR